MLDNQTYNLYFSDAGGFSPCTKRLTLLKNPKGTDYNHRCWNKDPSTLYTMYGPNIEPRWLLEFDQYSLEINRSECRCAVVAVCQAYAEFWTRHICWEYQVPLYISRQRAGYRCVLVIHCIPCTRLQSFPPDKAFVVHSLFSVILLTVKSIILILTYLLFKAFSSHLNAPRTALSNQSYYLELKYKLYSNRVGRKEANWHALAYPSRPTSIRYVVLYNLWDRLHVLPKISLVHGVLSVLA